MLKVVRVAVCVVRMRYLGSSIHLLRTDKCVIASAGQQAERATLHKVLKERIRMYAQKVRRTPRLGLFTLSPLDCVEP